MAKATITIVGLGKVGSSIGLALKTPELDFKIIGHDLDSEVAKQARSQGAVDDVSWHLLAACETADAVVLAIPFDQVQGTLKALGSELKPGCVVVDTSPFKQPVVEWANKYLADGTHFVGVSLGINPEAMADQTSGPAGARSDLFAKSPACLMPAPNCHPEAVKLGQDLVTLLGATPYFLDPAEFDGVSTVANLMPGMLAGALMGLATNSPSWREMRRLTSSDLAGFGRPLDSVGNALALAATKNKANTLYWLQAITQELDKLRDWIEQEDQEMLSAYMGAIHEDYEGWLASWQLNRWEDRPQAEMPTSSGWFGQLFGFGARRKSDRDQ